jgi:TonB family protein
MITAMLLVLATLAPDSAAGSSGPDKYQNFPLCRALEKVQPGEVMPVVVSGVYEVHYEAQVLFDPEQPACAWDVQPATWVEVSPAAAADSRLVALLEHSRRARVTIRGLLFGPGTLPPDDPSLPFAASLAKRMSNRRYGHLNSFRTKLVVEEILEVGSVADDTPWEWGAKPPSETLVPSPRSLDLPRYPEEARQLGVSGLIVIAVEVAGGRVTATHVKSGDRTLVSEAVSTVRSWRFDPGTKTSFTTTICYKLERRRAGDDEARIELHLPQSLTINAPSYDW